MLLKITRWKRRHFFIPLKMLSSFSRTSLRILMILATLLSTSQGQRKGGNVWINKLFFDRMVDFVPESAGNPKCNSQSSLYLEHLSNNSLWAVRSKSTFLKTFYLLLLLLEKDELWKAIIYCHCDHYVDLLWHTFHKYIYRAYMPQIEIPTNNFRDEEPIKSLYFN